MLQGNLESRRGWLEENEYYLNQVEGTPGTY